MDEDKLLKQLARCCSAPFILPDIEDRDQRDQFVLSVVQREFKNHGDVDRCFVFRATQPIPALVRIETRLTDELAQYAPWLGRAFASTFGARQLYHLSEMWFTQAQKGPYVPPSRNPERREALMVVSEDATRLPPMRIWIANITRDDKGKGTAGEWEDFGDIGGRLTYILPPEAYIGAGKPVPQA